ncbi:MAG: peptidylprolyl isomerase [Microcystis panniformis Mp_MB_F_20051200_S9]|uniref:peptidylprolyl isomerase n=1 Tax=Microcystis panniformis Mp_MB_F_20051200_S9 TaxID=2486223 RepID=A0A552Q367_9CHRO|nr:MAG: peptidylprolyl isomerase [Microcystis panniformis Mp_MB_F_20080800_S26D]TRV49921.1 MAG: peptidylprolyl isomerase [Microcystis panniformis Mp_GB_SS_20050300_S99D]TRV50471.1 MAG: peptidylprolyl isomerase [Microcystis panniformis Mp_GB_SS_20050300_S99]TRV63619.1 MAG: peptidylprolyl isomerase [Microcystis panniformis Mp_MB_F_20051200_S9]TRV65063.1 MAG: peptidylprolyl isomerase [Microcystis panniformis Mp_MB_F_20080800_S26]TRV67697.1 MAG: peptidylprolyl isomerase [Microcystis panniformis Mp
MSKTITITNEDILQQVKLSFKLPEILEEVIKRKIIESVAEEMGFSAETEELQEAADQLRLTHRLVGSDETWQWLEKFGLSLDNFEEVAKIKVLTKKLAKHFLVDKIDPYFYENQLNYSEAVLYEVIVDNEDEAIEIFFTLQEDEITFFDVAQKYIKDKELKRKGGYLGSIKKTDMKPEISAKVFASNPPQLLKPIVTAKGVHLIKVEEIIQPELTESLRYQILADLLGNWLNQQIEITEVAKKYE